MSRIRVGIIGLSTTSTSTSWASRAHLPYLQSAHGQERYEIVALCNSSKESAQKSVEHYKLASSIKTYDSAADLANDPDVDFVVNVTGVERHHELLLPVIQAGKNVFTELPLASNMEQMQELVKTANEKNVKTVFSTQGQTHPLTKFVREIITSGKIGKVLSSTWAGAGSFLGEKPIPLGLKAFGIRKVGANMMSVGFLHTINYVLCTLGDFESHNSILGNQRPEFRLIDPSQGGKLVETIRKDTPDQILLQGRLESGALLSYHLRGGDAFAGQPAVVWDIYGERGALRITNPYAALDMSHKGIKIEMNIFGEEKPQELTLPDDDLSALEHPGQNIGRIYEAYANGKVGGEGGYADWNVALKRHVLIEELWKRADEEGTLA